MNILFIYSDTINSNMYTKTATKPLHTQHDIQIGLSYLIKILENDNNNVELFVFSNKITIDALNKKIGTFNPSLICFSVVYREYNSIKILAKYVKDNYPLIYLVAGGPHITINPEEAIKKSFNAICIGEGEYPILELSKQLKKGIQPYKIPNLWFKKEDNIIKNPTRNFLEDLDKLPFPNRLIWQKWIQLKNTPHVVLVGRGCMFNCSYCCNHVFKKIASGNYVRFRTPKNIIEEIKSILIDFPKTHTIYLEVESININLNYLENLCIELEKFNILIDNKISYGTNYRITHSQNVEKVFKLFKRANIKSINIGVESGNKKIREKIMKRYYSNDDVKSVTRMAKKMNIRVLFYVMVGLPTETVYDFNDTIQLVKECKPYSIQLNIFNPYPGTHIYEYSIKNKFINGPIVDKGRHISSVNWPTFSKEEIQLQYDNFLKNIYGNKI